MTKVHEYLSIDEDAARDILLKDSQIEAIETSGVLHLKNKFKKDEMEALDSILSISTLSSAFSEHYPDGFKSWRGLTHNNIELSKFACDPRFILPAIQILGKNIRLIGSQYIIREYTKNRIFNRTAENPGWHRDIFHMSSDLKWQDPRCALKFMVCLSDAPNEVHGPTRFLKGSHLFNNPPAISNDEIDPKGWIDYRAEIGDIIIFENRTFHAGGICQSDTPFRIILLQYGYRWLAGLPAIKHSTEVLNNFNDFQRQILEPIDYDAHGNYAPSIWKELIGE